MDSFKAGHWESRLKLPCGGPRGKALGPVLKLLQQAREEAMLPWTRVVTVYMTRKRWGFDLF